MAQGRGFLLQALKLHGDVEMEIRAATMQGASRKEECTEYYRNINPVITLHRKSHGHFCAPAQMTTCWAGILGIVPMLSPSWHSNLWLPGVVTTEASRL